MPASYPVQLKRFYTDLGFLIVSQIGISISILSRCIFRCTFYFTMGINVQTFIRLYKWDFGCAIANDSFKFKCLIVGPNT